jgi:hypothetical protein
MPWQKGTISSPRQLADLAHRSRARRQRRYGDFALGLLLSTRPELSQIISADGCAWPTDHPRELATCWRLRKLNRGEASCDGWSHPLGRELRLYVNNELVRSQVFKGNDLVWADGQSSGGKRSLRGAGRTRRPARESARHNLVRAEVTSAITYRRVARQREWQRGWSQFRSRATMGRI